MCISYDCLNPANLALVVRRRQVIAQAHALNPASPSYEGADLCLGNQYRDGGGIVVPTLKEHVSKGLQAESQTKRRWMRSGVSGGGGFLQRWLPPSLLPQPVAVLELVVVFAWESSVFHKPDPGDARQRDVFPCQLSKCWTWRGVTCADQRNNVLQKDVRRPSESTRPFSR